MADAIDAGAPFFSIVIPAWNRQALIGRTINSCLAQDFADFEIVVVDDGSSDDTCGAVMAFGDPRIRYVWQANAGASAARNRGGAEARGQYLAFLDSDDEFLPGKLSAFHAAIAAAGPGYCWYSPLWFHRGDGNRLAKPTRAIGEGEPVGDYLFAAEGLMQTSTLVIPRDLFLKVGFDPALRTLEDLDLCLRLEAAGGRFRMVDGPQVVWYDDTPVGRLSYTVTPDHVLAWAGQARGLMTPRARAGFLARHAAPGLLRSRPIAAIGMLGRAVVAGGLSAPRAGSLLLRGIAPGAYGRLRDALVRRRAGA